MQSHVFKTAAATALALTALGAQAQLVNGNFSSGLTGWTALGDVSVPAQSGAATLTTAFAPDPDDGPYNLSGTAAAGIDDLEPAAGVALYALDMPNPPGANQQATEGSLLKQSFSVAAGQVLSFDWLFTTRETLSASPLLDNAFVVLNGTLIRLASSANVPAGMQTFSRALGAAGSVTLVFGVVDTGDFYGVSTLSVDNVRISPVPEPAAWALLLAGLCGVAAKARRRRRHTPLR